jgi:EAL domain-containing protein (putative c-di-GMP-specific phosphodiesterase class I)
VPGSRIIQRPAPLSALPWGFEPRTLRPAPPAGAKAPAPAADHNKVPPASAALNRRAPSPHSVADLIDRGEVRSVYQPLVDLYSGARIGYEALARGPESSPLESPAALFESAHIAGVRTELEWACQRAALQGAIEHGLTAGRSLFVNFEPDLAGTSTPPDLERLLAEALDSFPVFVELTERALIDHPSELLTVVRALRARGVGIALDDVGADPRSLALMPFLAPDVIKLDLRLVQDNPSPQVAEIVHAVAAEAERTGALVLAEGIETDAHRQTALALGARYGQGWLFGRPGELDHHESDVDEVPRRVVALGNDAPRSPFEVVTKKRGVRRGSKRLLLALSLQIEAQAASLGPYAVLLSSFQDARYFSEITARRYSRLATSAALVGAFGSGLSRTPAPGVRGVDLDPEDPVRGEWDVTLVGPQFAMAFVARDLGDDVADMNRRFDFAITYERELAVHAARALMRRVGP